MPKNDIGGFFVSLGLAIDRDSFETGNRLIDGIGNSFNKLIGSARNAAVVLAGTAAATGNVESAAYKMSEKLNISTESLDLWKASAKIAGVDANGLIGAMAKMSNVIDHIRVDGTGLDQFVNQLGKLGIVTDDLDIEKMLNMAPDELMTEIIRKAQEASAQAKKDIKEAQKALEVNPNDTAAQTRLTEGNQKNRQVLAIVGDILGNAGQNFYIELERQGKTIDEFIAGAGRTVFTTAEDNQKGADFRVQADTLKTELQSMSKLFGDSVAGELTPYLEKVNEFIQDHGDDIANGIKTITSAVGKLAGKLADWVKDEDTQEKLKKGKEVGTVVLDAAEDSIKGGYNATKEITTKIIEGDISGVGQAMLEGVNTTIVQPIEKVVTAATSGNETIQNYKTETGQSSTAATVNSGVRSIPGLKWIAHGSDFLMNKLGLMSDADYEANTAVVTQPKKEKKKKAKNEVNDGIMRPDGTVTQVAPDDWVFAARNLGDLAKAFIPESEPRPVTESATKDVPKAAPTVINQESNTPKEIPVTEPKQVTPQIKNEIQIVEPRAEKISPVQDTIVNIPEQQIQIAEPRETQNQPQIVVTEGKEKSLPAAMPAIQVMPEINVISPQEQRKQDFIPPAENEAPRLYAKDESPINNFVYQKQPQPQITTDWSIVAKTVSDLARSFIQPQPKAVQQSAGEYTINQTFNISGGNDLPQVLKQQAYHGTQEGLLELMQQTSNRLQLMSGTR